MRITRSCFVSLFLLSLPACGGRVIDESAGSDVTPAGSPSTASATDAGNDEDDADPSGPAGSGSGGGGGGSGISFPVCPPAAPNVGLSCITPNQGCVYVDVQRGTCISFVCDASERWRSSTPAGC